MINTMYTDNIIHREYNCNMNYTESTQYSNQIFNGTDFTSKDLSNVDFSNSEFTNVKFNNATLVNANFDHCTFENCDFNAANCTDAVFTNTLILNTSLKHCNLTNVTFNNSEFNSVVLNWAILRNSDFSHCDFLNTPLLRLKLIDCNLTHTWFDATVRFTETEFENCSIGDAVLIGETPIVWTTDYDVNIPVDILLYNTDKGVLFSTADAIQVSVNLLNKIIAESFKNEI